MKTILPTVLLGIACAALGLGLYVSQGKLQDLDSDNQKLNQTITELEAENERLRTARSPDGIPVPVSKPAMTEVVEVAAAVPSPEDLSPEPVPEPKENPGERMMRSISKMMDNPTMNKVMEASQRGAVSALYEDLVDYLELEGEEKDYFMDLLVSRQMQNVDVGMKMMKGGLSEEEQKALGDELQETTELIKEEIAYFLNNEEDVAEWEFYEKTMGERMMLSQMDQALADSDEMLPFDTYRELLEAMSEEKEAFSFTGDLHDPDNTDLSAERFSVENLESFARDQDQLNVRFSERAKTMLSTRQFEAFSESLKTSTEMQRAQLEMAAQMFSGETE